MPKYRLITQSGAWMFEATPGEDLEKRASSFLSKSGDPEGQLERQVIDAGGRPDWERVKNIHRMRGADEA